MVCTIIYILKQVSNTIQFVSAPHTITRTDIKDKKRYFQGGWFAVAQLPGQRNYRY